VQCSLRKGIVFISYSSSSYVILPKKEKVMLSKTDFTHIIKNTPLVSIDLIIENREKKILLGKRLNKPAQNDWFVPGGRIFKDERLDDAFSRISSAEIGVVLQRSKREFLGVYEHFYADNAINDEFSTHYVVLAYRVEVDEREVVLNNQHEAYRWFEIDELLAHESVNQYTKNYFL
jgi:colanic acid biosynthesis protein WcaH